MVVDTITIMYGLAGHRSILRTRALSFSIYVIFLVAAVSLLPLVLAGPGLVDRVLPERLDLVAYLYWPVVLLGGTVALATQYHRGTGADALASDLPGAALTLLIWLGGSALLRMILGLAIGCTVDLRSAGGTDRRVAVALPDQPGVAGRGGLQRQSATRVSRAQSLKKWTGFSISEI